LVMDRIPQLLLLLSLNFPPRKNPSPQSTLLKPLPRNQNCLHRFSRRRRATERNTPLKKKA